MSNNKQSSVEWLVDELEKHYVNHDLKNTVVFEQAKAMHKEDNENTWIAGVEYALSVLKDKTSKDSKKSFEQYYNEKYGKDNANNTAV